MPYIVGHPIKRPADFYGRSEHATRFFEIIAGPQAQSASVLGLRRAGKTSFLQYVAHPEVMARYLPDVRDYVMVYIDMSSCKTPADFYQRLLLRLKNILGQPKQINLWKESPIGRSSIYDVETLLCHFPDRRIILLLDEFDRLKSGSFDQDFLTELRAMTGVLDYELACVTASYWDLYHLGSSIGLPPTSPFYNIFYPSPIYLSGLETVEALALIRTPARRAGIPFSDDDVAAIREQAGTLPFFLQATAARWFQYRQTGQSYTTATIHDQLMVELSPYFAQWWRAFSDAERMVLLQVASTRAVAATGVTTARRLSRYGVLLEQNGGYTLNGSLYTTWIRQATEVERDNSQGPNTVTEALNPVALRHVLSNHFDMEELRTLCFDLGVDFDELSGSSKRAKAMALVVHWQHRGELHRLVEAIRSERGAVV